VESIPYNGTTELVFISLEEDDLLMESIRQSCREQNICHGIILSGAAAIKKARVHYIAHTTYPPNDVIHTIEAPFEMSSIGGIIVDYEPHVHIALMQGEDEAAGGHLEDGTVVAYRGELAVMKCNDAPLKREKNEKGVPILRSIKLEDF